MNRAPLRSMWLVLAVTACSGSKTHPGVAGAEDVVFVLDDLGTSATDQPSTTDGGATTADATATDAPTTDVTTTDVTTANDVGVIGAGATDTGPRDTGATTDTGPRDTGATDLGVTDTGARDAGATDSGAAADGGACASGLTTCGPPGGPFVCTGLNSDTANCGACGTRCCSALDHCTAGACISHCSLLQLSCPMTAAVDAGCVATQCVDPMNDHDNCGACGHACAMDEDCLDGHCF